MKPLLLMLPPLLGGAAAWTATGPRVGGVGSILDPRLVSSHQRRAASSSTVLLASSTASREDGEGEGSSSSRRSFLTRQAASVLAAAATAASSASSPRPAVAEGGGGDGGELIDVYFGCGCFWHVQVRARCMLVLRAFAVFLVFDAM